jgi:hypothetical protein
MNHKIMATVFLGLVGMLALPACGLLGQQLAEKSNEERLLKPGALDLPLTGINDTYQFKFLDKYRITHQWPRISNCQYRKLPTLKVKDGNHGEFWAASDIYEKDDHTWQIGAMPFEEYKQRYSRKDAPAKTFEDYAKSMSFDRYVRSVKVMNPVYAEVEGTRQRIGEEEIEAGLQSLCFQSWYATSHSMVMRLHKRDLTAWKTRWTQFNPKGKWSEQRVGSNLWTIQEVPESELSPRAAGASGGWFQSWLLPIGDTGYTLSLQLGASAESMQHPDAHIRMKTSFLQLVESVKIEALAP